MSNNDDIVLYSFTNSHSWATNEDIYINIDIIDT